MAEAENSFHSILPTEIWLQILSYIELHEIIDAFSDLNQFFDQLLRSPHLRVHFRMKKHDANENVSRELRERFPLGAVRSLGFRRRSRNALIQFLHWNSTHLIHLEVLSIYLRPRTVQKSFRRLLKVLDGLPSLKSLRILAVFRDVGWRRIDVADLHRKIFSNLLQLKHCELIFEPNYFDLSRTTGPGPSTIRRLTIKTVTWSNLLVILSTTPYLVVLDTYLTDFRPDPFTFSLPSLRKLSLGLCNTQFVVLEEIRRLAPSVNYLWIWGSFPPDDENYLREHVWRKLLDGIDFYRVELDYLGYPTSRYESVQTRFAPLIENGWLKVVQGRSYGLRLELRFRSKSQI